MGEKYMLLHVYRCHEANLVCSLVCWCFHQGGLCGQIGVKHVKPFKLTCKSSDMFSHSIFSFPIFHFLLLRQADGRVYYSDIIMYLNVLFTRLICWLSIDAVTRFRGLKCVQNTYLKHTNQFNYFFHFFNSGKAKAIKTHL